MHGQKRVLDSIRQIYRQAFERIVKGNNRSAFTRNRKVNIPWIILSILNRRGKTQKMELRNFLKLTRCTKTLSAWGYTKARLKVSPDAFTYLNDCFLTQYYCKDNPDRRTYKGYLPVAIDGTDIHLPTTAQTRAIFGDANSRSAYAVVMGSVSCAYDVCNDLILDARLSRYKRSERASAREHISRITKSFPQECIFLFDRGYPSAEFLMELLDARQKFLFRLGGSTFKREQETQKEADSWIEIALDQTRINPHRGTPLAEKMRQTGSLHLRMTRITLPGGEKEVLLSNLPEDLCSMDELKELYHMRWKIETMYDTLKNKLQLENFSGTLPLLIAQDFCATIYLYNLISDIQHDAETGMTLPKRRYGVKANQTMAIGLIKEVLVQMATARSGTIRVLIYQRIISEIQAYTVPVRPDRHYPRNTATRRTKFSMNRKSSY